MARCRQPSRYLRPGLLSLLLALAAQPIWAELPMEIRRELLKRDYAAAAAGLLPLAEAGDANALYELGRLCDRGLGVPQDPARGAGYLQAAADQGHANAAYLLGTLYERGQGVPADPARAEALFAQADEQGHELARRKRALQADGTAAQSQAGSSRRDIQQSLISAETANQPDAHGRLPLGNSVLREDAGRMERLLAAGAAVSARDSLGNSALHYAVQVQSTAAVKRLIAAGADLSVPDGAGNTPLHLAVAADLPDIAGSLLAAGATRDRMNKAGWSPAMLSQRSDIPEMLALFGGAPASRTGASLAQLAALQANPGMRDWSLLAIAAWRGELDLVEALVKKGADVSAVDASGSSPLARAVTGKRQAVARYLIEQGADLHQSVDGGSLLHEAIRQRDLDMVKLLAQQPALLDRPDGSGRSPLILALQREDWAAVEVLLEHGALPDGVDGAGSTPLHLVTRNDNVDLARRLLAAGAALNIGDGAGRTPLWWAARSGSLPLVSMFLEAGALDAAALDGSTPVHEAAQLEQPDVLGLLADAGYALDVRTDAGSTPLLLAAERGGADTVSYLVDRGQDVNAINNAGDSALICAVRNDRKDVAKRLIAHGANPRLRNAQFVSAGDLAEAHEDEEWDNILASSRGLLGLFGGKS